MRTAVVLGCLVAIAAAAPSAPVRVGEFSSLAAGDPLPTAWKPLTFSSIGRHTEYRLVELDGRVVVRADSTASASGIMREIEVDPAVHPWLGFSWRIENVLEKGDVTKRSGDDYPARVYVTFAHDPEASGLLERTQFEALRLLYGHYPPGSALNYIWASRAEVGAVLPNTYTSRNRMIVLQSGDARAGQWVSERRDVAADYRAAFGAEPPKISGVAIMTDTDDTGESALAWFGDIVFESRAD